MAIVTCLLGLHHGHVVVHFKVRYHCRSFELHCIECKIIHFPSPKRWIMQDHRVRISHWLIADASLMSVGLLLNHNGMFSKLALDFHYLVTYVWKLANLRNAFATGMHLNKALYSLSYTCVTAGAASLIHAVIYILVKYSLTAFVVSFDKPVVSAYFDWSYIS